MWEWFLKAIKQIKHQYCFSHHILKSFFFHFSRRRFLMAWLLSNWIQMNNDFCSCDVSDDETRWRSFRLSHSIIGTLTDWEEIIGFLKLLFKLILCHFPQLLLHLSCFALIIVWHNSSCNQQFICLNDEKQRESSILGDKESCVKAWKMRSSISMMIWLLL